MKKLGISLLALALGACASNEAPKPVKPLRGPATQEVTTDYSESLKCLATYSKRQSYPAPRIAVGHITDLTGASDYISGRRLTQGATLMAITAVSDSGMRLVERFDMSVIQVELDYAQSGLIRDSQSKLRQLQAGQLQGVDLYIVGGITEFNPNIRSRDADFYLGSTNETGGALAIGKGEYIIDVGLDLRLVDVRTSEVLSVRSFRKQVVGKEIEAGVFDFFDGNVVDVGGGQRALEPVQTAVRTMIDRAVYEFVSSLYNIPENSCLKGEARRQIASLDGVHTRGANAAVIQQQAVARRPVPQMAGRPQSSSSRSGIVRPSHLPQNLSRTTVSEPSGVNNQMQRDRTRDHIINGGRPRG